MSLDKVNLRNKVKQGIKLMPSIGLVVRTITDNHNERTSYGKIGDLTGVLYSTNGSNSTSNSLQDKGEMFSSVLKKYLIDYNSISAMVKKGDYIFFSNNTSYRVIDIDENFEVYVEFTCVKDTLKHENNYIKDNGSYFEIIEVPNDFWGD